MMNIFRLWPDPLLQPIPREGCINYAVAYLCHCFGRMEITPEQVADFRIQERKIEAMFPKLHCGLEIERFFDYVDKDENELYRYWLGPDTREWVEQHLASGQVGLVIVERVPGLAHALVVLESRGNEGVLVMDSLYGHRIDTWEWFLSVGAGNQGCHHIDGWYSLSEEARR